MILNTVLLSLIGVFLGLMITHTPFGIIMTGVGVISLAGFLLYYLVSFVSSSLLSLLIVKLYIYILMPALVAAI